MKTGESDPCANDDIMKRIISITGLIALLSISAAGQSAADRPTITVNGQASVMAVPDEVVFTLEADNVNLDINLAKAKTDEDVKKVFALAKTYQIAPQYVQTDYVKIAKRWGERIQNKPAPFLGYAVSQRILVVLKDVSRFDGFLSEVVKSGITSLSDLNFRASAMRKYMDQARSMAMKAAKEKATALAGEIGQQIGKAVNITEVGLSVSSAYGDADEDNSNARSNYTGNISEDIARSLSDNQGTLAPGMISITARVKVVFELR
jgi:uncharacterized protein YggE